MPHPLRSMTPSRYHLGDAVTRVSMQYPQVCQCTTSYYGDQPHGGGRGAKSCERVAHRSGQHSSWTPTPAATGTQGSITCFSRKITSVSSAAAKAPTAQFTHKPAQASATKDPIAEPLDKSSTASAAETPTTNVQAGSTSSNHYCHTPCCHTSCRLPVVWQQNVQPLIAITPLPVWRVSATLLCNHCYHTHCVTPLKLYHPGDTLNQIPN